MAKSIKLKDNNYIDSTGIVHNKLMLSEYLPTRVITSGSRNMYYLIARTLIEYGGSTSAGTGLIFCNRWRVYQDGTPVIFFYNANGSVSKFLLGEDGGSSHKILYNYRDSTYNYYILYAPNYNDNWYCDLITCNNSEIFTNYVMNQSSFNSFIAGKTLFSQT